MEFNFWTEYRIQLIFGVLNVARIPRKDTDMFSQPEVKNYSSLYELGGNDGNPQADFETEQTCRVPMDPL